jgi:hypothetical protein
MEFVGERQHDARLVVEMTTDGAIEHMDALTRAYTSHPNFYGYAIY